MNKIVLCVKPELKPIVPTFLQDQKQELDALREALHTWDFGTISELGEHMYELGNEYGFEFFAETGAAIRQSARYRDACEICRHIVEIKKYMENLEVVYRDMPGGYFISSLA